MQILSSLQADVWHNLTEPGSYEWWYFDAVADDERYSIVAIWFSGFPFSPYYLKRLRAWKQSGAKNGASFPNPLEHAAFSFSLYADGVEVVNFIKEGDAALFEASTEKPFARFERNWFAYDEIRNCFVLRLDFEMPARKKRVKAELRFTPKMELDDDLGELSSGEGEHAWILVAPSMDVKGEIHVWDGLKNDERNIAFRGSGYHDHNFGRAPMDAHIENWYWGRAHSKKHDLVYYIISYKDQSREPFTFLYLAENGKPLILENRLTIIEHELEQNLISPRYGKRLTMESGDCRFSIEHLKCLDTGPFYVRFYSRFALNLQEKGGVAMTGISEFLHPERLTSGIVQNLVKSKVLREGRLSVMYALYNFFNRFLEQRR
ncbi:MAG: carotenoid 1,2-hydratase [Chloroherpetonaceae bacterium]|nr:carotenoid 1,2-hydratase [Chloroherpetonaceae bacterium]MDW8436619.1 carotenoid 1,2-hydratase [Chloroherpetonaceae bacterium]